MQIVSGQTSSQRKSYEMIDKDIKVCPRKEINTKSNFLKTTGRISFGPYNFCMSRPERADNASLEEILMAGINESVGSDD